MLFHTMGKVVQDFWPRVSFGIFGYDMSRSHSIMRIATTASPVSGMEVRAMMLELQRQQQRSWAALKMQTLRRMQVALHASDEQLLVMSMSGALSQAQMAKIAAEKAKRAGQVAQRRGGILGEVEGVAPEGVSPSALLEEEVRGTFGALCPIRPPLTSPMTTHTHPPPPSPLSHTHLEIVWRQRACLSLPR